MLSSDTFDKISKIDKKIGYSHIGHFGKGDTGFDTLHDITTDHSEAGIKNEGPYVELEIANDPDSSNWHFQLKH